MFVNANYNNTMFTITDHKGITPLDFLFPISISSFCMECYKLLLQQEGHNLVV